MRTRTFLTAPPVIAVGALLGYQAASGRLTTALAQDRQAESPPATGGTG
jgi:hypothetical protein